MAECPLKMSVVEKDPDKNRLKCSFANATVDNNVDGSEESKAHDCEMPKKVGQEEVGLTKTEEDLLTISDSTFQSLLQEASQPLFDRNSEKSKLLRKVIDETNFKDSPCQVSFCRTWGCRKDGGRKSDRRNRLDSCGHGGNSAAACTTQGGSLQNLHGKPESKKLRKSGSLSTFPASNSICADSCSKLEVLKQFLTSKVPTTSHARRNSGQSTVPAAIRAKGASEPLCDGVIAEISGDPSRECRIGSEAHPVAQGACDAGSMERVRPSLDRKSFSKSTEEEEDAEVVVEEIEMMDIDRSNDDTDIEALPLIKNGSCAASAGGSQPSDWITARPYGFVDGFRNKSMKSQEVDASVSMPLSLKSSQSGCYTSSKANYNNYLLDAKSEQKLVMLNEKKKLENEEGKSTVVAGTVDENGNPPNSTSCYNEEQKHRQSQIQSHIQSQIQTQIQTQSQIQSQILSQIQSQSQIQSESEGVVCPASETVSVSSESSSKTQRKKKKTHKEVDLHPSAMPGYFGEMDIEDILKRINSKEDLTDDKMNVGIDSRKKGLQKEKDNLKSSGTKVKRIAPSRDVSKKNLENDMSRLNGSKENIIGHGLKEALLDGIGDNDDPIALQTAMDKSLKPKNDELSHQLLDYVENNRFPKPSADITVEAFPLSTCLNAKEDGASKYPDSHELTNHVNNEDDTNGHLAEEKPTSPQPVSSFAVDFYSNPEAQLVPEDSEFCEVKKKKKNKPRSTKGEGSSYYRSNGGDGSTYSGSSGSSVVNEDGRRAQPASWANLSNLSRRSQRGSEDVRRKSTSSVPHSEHSSADNSDVESVHSLPVSSTTPKTVVGKTSSSSSCTPQASYADIAKMATTANTSRRPLTTSPFKADVSQFLDLSGSSSQSEPAAPPVETKRDASTSTAEGSEPSERCDECEPNPDCAKLCRPDQNGDINKGVLDFINSESLRAENLPRASLPAVPVDNAVSISAIEASSRIYSAAAPSRGTNRAADVPAANEPFHERAVDTSTSTSSMSWGDVSDAGFKPGVVFVGALDVPTDELLEVTFGFEVNEELLRMTAQRPPRQRTTAGGGRTETQVPSRSRPSLEEDTTVYHFTSSSEDAANVPPAEDECEESRETKSSPSDTYVEEMQYFNYQNVVDFIGRAWDGVQEELRKESQSDSGKRPAKVQYYRRTE